MLHRVRGLTYVPRPNSRPRLLLSATSTQQNLTPPPFLLQQENMRWILKQQRLEDEAKEDEARPKQHKALASRYVSRRGYVDTIFFPDAYYLPPVLCQLPFSADSKAEGGEGAGDGQSTDRLCKITGAPARYKDPLTGYRYADASAFRELRKRYGASARRRVKAQQQEREAKEAASRGGSSATGAAPATGSRVEIDAAVAGAGAGIGAGAAGATSSSAAGGVAGNGSLKGAGASHAAGGQSSGQSKKQGSSKEGEKKAKSSGGKGKGKTKGAAKAAAAAAAAAVKAESSTAVPTSSGDDGAGRQRQEKTKAGTKRPRKQGGATKGAKPAKRPFFAPAPEAAAPAEAPVAMDEDELVPLKGHAAVHRGNGPAEQGAAPLGAGRAVDDAVPATSSWHVAQGNAGVAYARPLADAPAGGSAPPVHSPVAAPAPAIPLTYAAMSAAHAATIAPAEAARLGVEWAPEEQHLNVGGMGEVSNGCKAGSNSAVVPKCLGWQQPTPAITPLGRPPG